MKVVIMGSSTAFGVGASTYSNSWAGKTEAFLNRNTTDGLDTVFYNIASPGYDTYQEMPTGFVPPAGRPLPDEFYNVTKALSYNPDIVIINLPSNDISYGYSKAEMINNLRTMSSTIFANGIRRCYITTPQPRNDFDQDHRDSLLSLVDSVNNSFGPYAINFWDGLVTTDGLSMLKDQYRAIPSPIHLNDDGHNLLFERIKNSYIFGLLGPVALQLTSFQAQLQNNAVLIKWHTEQQAANTIFELQKSADGRTFETSFTQTVVEARQSSDYSTSDQTAFSGKTFYRLKITEAGRQYYSATINITGPGKLLNISKLYTDNSGANLIVDINIQKSQLVDISIIGSSGLTFARKKEFITQPGNSIRIPIESLTAGQYFVRVISKDASIVKSFTK
ncbi:MAG: hypothetical protein H7258_07995 [Ferruginibacter sp.]|nr:hypothetical protein [Ferruginibacter sp.]